MKTTMLLSDEIIEANLPTTLTVVHPSTNRQKTETPDTPSTSQSANHLVAAVNKKMPVTTSSHASGVTNNSGSGGASKHTQFSFDRSFQEKIVQAMIMDRVWSAQIAEVLQVDFFEYGYLKKISASYLDYHNKYKEFPSIDLLATIVAGELKNPADETMRNQVRDFLVRVSEHRDLGDLKFVKEKALDFCKRVGLQKALEQSIDFIETEKYEKVVETIKKAISAGTEHSAGLNLTEDVDARYSETFRRTVATGIPELDQRKILNGGLGAGEIGVVIAPTGCHARGTKILMHNGTVKNVEDVGLGDQLMGPDSKPRMVTRVIRGREKMYEITPNRGGDAFIVNENHMLSLRRTNDGTSNANRTINITVKEYLTKSNTFKHCHKLWRTGVEFERPIPTGISPYVLGLLLGDGWLSNARIELTSADSEIVSAFVNEVHRHGNEVSVHLKKDNKACGYYVTRGEKELGLGGKNHILNMLSLLGLVNTNSATKFIPYAYKCASRKDRLELLAGLIDTDGCLSNSCYEYVSKSKQLAEDVEFVARSLGLQASSSAKLINGETYWRVNLSGNTSIVPSRLARKTAKPRQQKKNALVSGFSIVELPEDDFFGFTINEDHLYLTGDFTVHHNCGKSHVLTHVGAQALLRGKNVLHYTFELNERAIGIRYDSHLLDINSLDCIDHRDEIKKFYKDNETILGQLRIKYYPTGGATVNTLRAHIDKLATEGFVPDLLIVDYAGIMRSTEKYELLRLELKKIYEELRGFANELDIPIWTASQSNKEGADKDIVDLTNMAEAYGQAHVADFVLGLSRKSLDKSTGYGNIFIAKNRAGVDGVQYQIILDTAKSKLRVLTDSEAAGMKQDMELMEDGNLKNFFRSKIRDYQKRQ